VESNVVSKDSGAVDFDVSPTGTLVYLPGTARGADQHLAWRDQDARETPIGVSVRPISGLELSPDGRLAAAWGPASNNGLWLIDLTRAISTRLPTGDLDVRGPIAWTRDSKEVAFASPGGKVEAGIFKISVSGTSTPVRLTTAPADDPGASTTALQVRLHFPGSWTPDGRHLIFFEAGRGGDAVIKRLTIGDKLEIEPLIAGPTIDAYATPALSPDGRWLAYMSVEAGGQGIFLRPYPNINEQRIPVSMDFAADPTWSRDGRELFYMARPATLMVVRVGEGQRPTLSKPEVLMPLDDPSGQLVVSPESSQRILVAHRRAPTTDQSNAYRVVLNWTEELKARAPH
jgi:Tol biopolymer transport system component